MNNEPHSNHNNPASPAELAAHIVKTNKENMRKPTQHTNHRTSAYLRHRGFTVDVVQTWNAAAQKRQDLYGLFDVIAVRPDVGILAAQAVTKTHLADHRRKLQDAVEAISWLQSGGKIMLFSWRKVGAKGERLLWKPRVEEAILTNGVVSFVLLKDGSAFLDLNGGEEGLAAAA